MPRPLALAALALIVAACDTAAPPVAGVSAGSEYAVTTFRLVDDATGAVVFDYLEHGAEVGVEFTTADRFRARLFVPQSALVASGETDDVGGDVDWTVLGDYAQSDGAVAFTADPEPFTDTFFDRTEWAISADGRTLRYHDTEDGRRGEVVLTRR